jgi:hypothetical protein
VHESLSSSSVSARRPLRFRATFRTFPTHIRQLEAEQEAFYLWQRSERRKIARQKMKKLWPLAVGVLLGAVAPQMHALMARFEPWGLWLVFPFAVLACRPELHTLGQLIRNLPQIVVYLQFPLEGLLARLILKRRITVRAVAGHVCYFHYLAGLQLLMLSGAVARALGL